MVFILSVYIFKTNIFLLKNQVQSMGSSLLLTSNQKYIPWEYFIGHTKVSSFQQKECVL